jgi:hypothetical protein
MRIRLTRKLALCLNGVAVSDLRDGEEVELSERSAQILVLGGWVHPLAASQSPTRKRVRYSRHATVWNDRYVVGRD